MVVKIKKMMHFDPDDGFFPWQLAQDITLWQIFFSNLYLFGSIFSVIFWNNRLHSFDEGMCFADNCYYENCQICAERAATSILNTTFS